MLATLNSVAHNPLKINEILQNRAINQLTVRPDRIHGILALEIGKFKWNITGSTVFF